MSSFCHEALLYSGDDELVERALPIIRDAISAAVPAMVAVSARKAERLAAALSDDAEKVQFCDAAALGRNPARIISRWRDFIADTAGAPSRLGISEPQWCELEHDQRRGSEQKQCSGCRHHEALLTLAFRRGPPWRLVCLYDSANLPAEAIEQACRSHPTVAAAGTRRASERYDPEAELGFVADSLPTDKAGAATLDVTIDELGGARSIVMARALAAGLGEARSADLVLAIDEVLVNSIRHGGGTGRLQIWREPRSIVCEVADRGRITDPLVGRRRPDPRRAGGYGLWLVNQLCDLVQIRSGEDGTSVRLRMSLSPQPVA